MDNTRDVKWSNEVKERYEGQCPHCGSRECSSHHIVPRSCLKTRYIIENGIFCCDILHRAFEGKVKEFDKNKAIRIYIGQKRFNNLNKIKNGLNSFEDFGYREVI